MSALQVLQTYFFYLIHPFRTHRILRERGDLVAARDEEFPLLSLSVYESLGASWVFIVISGMLKIIIINGLIYLFMGVMDPATGFLTHFYDGDRFIGFYFVILTTILDVIFFPLITLFVIQFWEFVLRAYANLAGVEGDIEEKSKAILSVALSSHILQVAPIVGDMAQKFAHFIQMYAGIREQLGFSRSLTFCVLLTPVLIILFFVSLIVMLAAL